MITVDFNRIPIISGSKILDIGCGSGRHTSEAYRHPKALAIGTDLSFEDLTAAGERLELHDRLGEHGGGSWGLSVADANRLPFPNDYFDVVICSEVLEHIQEHQMAIREVVRVLKPGCNLVVSVPRFWPERICWALSEDYYKINGGHVRIYRRKELIHLLETNGVKLWSRHYAHSLHSPFWWLKCLVGPGRDDSKAVNLYHRFLTWDMMKHPWLTKTMDWLLNPVMGKSLVLYLKKESIPGYREPDSG